MSSKRPIALMGILLLALGWASYEYEFKYHPTVRDWIARWDALPGENTVSQPQLKQLPDGRWEVSFDYFFTGAPANATIWLEYRNSNPGPANPGNPDPTGVQVIPMASPMPMRGQHRAVAIFDRPAYSVGATEAREITARMRSGHGKPPLALARTDKIIAWPDAATWETDRLLAGRTPEENVKQAALLIDLGEQAPMAEAKRMLDRLLQKDTKLEPAYLEMARIAMKTNWGPEGLQQAEALIGTALQLKPDSVNARILLAYVYMHQQRFAESEALMVAAAQADPPNLWLWANWGEFHELQGKIEPAIAKYQEALKRPPTRDTHDRARQFAYDHLLAIQWRRDDLDAVEALNRQRHEEYPGEKCFSTQYARFLLQHRGDAAAAAGVLAKPHKCRPDYAQQVNGMLHYATWARAQGEAGAESLRQARVLAPLGPWMLYQLATGEHTVPVVQKLLAAGDRIDLKDNEQFDALAYAVRERNHAATRRLIRLGAKPTALVGAGQLPIALLPVLMRDFEGIRVMRAAGIDYTKLRYQGSTALDHAREQDDQELLRALDPKARASALGA